MDRIDCIYYGSWIDLVGIMGYMVSLLLPADRLIDYSALTVENGEYILMLSGITTRVSSYSHCQKV